MPRVGAGGAADAAYTDPQFHVPARPALRAGVRVVETEHGLALDGGPAPLLVGGATAATLRALVGALDGARTAADLAAAAGLRPAVVARLLGLLTVRDLVRDGPSAAAGPAEVAGRRPDRAGWCYLARAAPVTGVHGGPAGPAAVLAAATVAVCGHRPFAAAVAQRLGQTGLIGRVTWVDALVDEPGSDLVAWCVAGGYRPDQLDRAVAASQAHVPVLPLLVAGAALTCGPILGPAGPACPRCALGSVPPGPPPTDLGILAGLAVGEILHRLGRFGRTLSGTRVVRHDADTWRSTRYEAIAAPGCADCADRTAAECLVEAYEAAVALPGRSWLEPAVHRGHYDRRNLAAQTTFSAVDGPALDLDTAGPPLRVLGGLLRRCAGLRRPPLPDPADPDTHSPGDAGHTPDHGAGRPDRAGVPDRYVPSAGNLGAVVAYPLLTTGLYQYDPWRHVLLACPLGAGMLAGLWADLLGGTSHDDILFGVVLRADLTRLYPKYGLKSYRLAWLEAGAALGALTLAAAGAGLPVAAVDSWRDELWEAALPDVGRGELNCAMALVRGRQ